MLKQYMLSVHFQCCKKYIIVVRKTLRLSQQLYSVKFRPVLNLFIQLHYAHSKLISHLVQLFRSVKVNAVPGAMKH